MPVITFRERMVGAARTVPERAVDLPPRGPSCGDGVFDAVRTDTSPTTSVLDLRDLDVRIDDVDPLRDGFRGVVERGRVGGVVTGSVVAGFVDLLAQADSGRRMTYRLLVRPDVETGWLVVEGVKELRHGVVGAWSETTTLGARVVRPGPDDVTRIDRAADRGAVLAGGFTDAREIATGVLRVRGLVRQAASMRGARLRFLAGFVRRLVG